LIASAATTASSFALTVEPEPIAACTVTSRTPMSTPPPTPTKPPAAPPATVSVLALSTALTFTDWSAFALGSSLIVTPVPTSALTVIPRSVTPTAPATPTKPPPIAAANPNTFSDDEAWTATPWNAPAENVPKPLPAYSPVLIPERPVPSPSPFTLLPLPMEDSTVFVSVATPTVAPTPTKPPARPIWINSSFVSSEAATSTSPPATIVTLPVRARVVTSRTVTPTLPATPTVPPPAPTTTLTIESLPVAVTSTSFAAFTVAPLPTKASVVMWTMCTPTGTAIPALPAIASEPAMPSS
jgi:hypothetical protein